MCETRNVGIYCGSSNRGMYAGLNKRTTSNGLKEAFSKFGQVIEGIYWIIAQLFLQVLIPYSMWWSNTVYAARVITDRISGYSRGFGFVKYATVQEAGEAIKGMDGKVSECGWLQLVFQVHCFIHERR